MTESPPFVVVRTAAISCLMLLFAVISAGQYKEWRPVSAQDLETDMSTVEPDTDAEALFWEMRIDDRSFGDLDIWHYVRVKIFNERGREKYSRFDIPYTKGMKIKDLAARVIHPNGKITEIGKQDIFDRELLRAGGSRIKVRSFAVPGIEPGVIVEYKYQEAIDNAGASGMRLPLQRDIPVREMVYYYRPYGKKDPQYQLYNLKDLDFSKDTQNFWRAARYSVRAFKSEIQMPPEDTVRPWVLLTSTRARVTFDRSGVFRLIVKNPSDRRRYWGSFAIERRSYQNLIFSMMKKERSDFTRAANAIVGDAVADEEKIRRIYDFCQREVKNLVYDPLIREQPPARQYQLRELEKLIRTKEARLPQQVNWLFAGLAEAAGLDVYFAYTGDKNEIFFDPDMTNERLLSDAAIAVKLGDEFRFFAPGDPFLPYGSIPWNIESSPAFVVGKDQHGWVVTPISDRLSNNYRRTGEFVLTDDGELEGKVTVQLTGQPAFGFRHSNYDISGEMLEKYLSETIREHMGAAEINDVKIENLRDPDKPLIQSYSIRVPNYAQRTGSRIFLQPGFFEYGKPARFSSNSRNFDVFFPYPWSESDELTIKLPEGYELENAERPFPISDPDKVGSLDITIGINRDTNTLIYNRQFEFGLPSTMRFPKESYAPLKTMFDVFKKADSHTIAMRQKGR
jgi:hypothetical protein